MGPDDDHRWGTRPLRRFAHSWVLVKRSWSATIPVTRMTNITPMTPAMSGTEEADSRRKPRPTVAKMSSAPMSDRQAKDHPTFAAEMRCGRAAGTVTRRIRSIPSDPMLRAARRYRGGTVRNASANAMLTPNTEPTIVTKSKVVSDNPNQMMARGTHAIDGKVWNPRIYGWMPFPKVANRTMKNARRAVAIHLDPAGRRVLEARDQAE